MTEAGRGNPRPFKEVRVGPLSTRKWARIGQGFPYGIVGVIGDSTGVDLQRAVTADNPRFWSQIHTAFELRHLIEHTNGKVDADFWNKVVPQGHWSNSSWGNIDIAVGLKVDIREQDFDQTFLGMVAATDITAARLKEFDPIVDRRALKRRKAKGVGMKSEKVPKA